MKAAKITTAKVLRNSGEIRAAVRRIFSDPRSRRAALVAYVGSGAEDYLPSPTGIELVCWDKEGSTDPDVIYELRHEHHVKVAFAKNLHMKVFWSEKYGAVIGSANLSQNGLADNRLHEVAVLLPPRAIDIDNLKAQINPVPATGAALRDLYKRTRRYRARNAGKTIYPSTTPRRKKRTFVEWYKTASDGPDWRLFAYCEHFEGLTKEAKQELKSRGYRSCESYWMGVKGHAQPFEWLLSVDTNPRGDGICWSCADFVVPVNRADEEFYDRRWPFFVVQISPTRVYGSAPFNEKEKPFTRAIRKLLEEAEVETYVEGLRFAPDGVMSKKALKRLSELCKAESRR